MQEEYQNQIEGGYFLIARKLFNSKIWSKPPQYLKLFVYILGNAKFKTCDQNGVTVNRSELLTSRKGLLKQINSTKFKNSKSQFTESNIKDILDFLVEDGIISTTRFGSKLRIIINNYELYQNHANYGKKPVRKSIPEFSPELSPEINSDYPPKSEVEITEQIQIETQNLEPSDSPLSPEVIVDYPLDSPPNSPSLLLIKNNDKKNDMPNSSYSPEQEIEVENEKPSVDLVVKILGITDYKPSQKLLKKFMEYYGHDLPDYKLKVEAEKISRVKSLDDRRDMLNNLVDSGQTTYAKIKQDGSVKVNKDFEKSWVESELSKVDIDQFKGISKKNVPIGLLEKFEKYCTLDKFKIALDKYFKLRFPSWKATEKDFKNYQIRRLSFTDDEWRIAIRNFFWITEHHVEYWAKMTPSHFFSDPAIIRNCIEDDELNNRTHQKLKDDPLFRMRFRA